MYLQDETGQVLTSALRSYLCALLIILVTISEVHPATSRPPATLGLAAADPGDHKQRMMGTSQSSLIAGPWVGPGQGLMQKYLLCACCIQDHWGVVKMPDRLLISRLSLVQARELIISV